MKEWICEEEPVYDLDCNITDYALSIITELVRCKDCKQFGRYANAPKKYQNDGFCRWWERDTCLDYWCCGAERKAE